MFSLLQQFVFILFYLLICYFKYCFTVVFFLLVSPYFSYLLFYSPAHRVRASFPARWEATAVPVWRGKKEGLPGRAQRVELARGRLLEISIV